MPLSVLEAFVEIENTYVDVLIYLKKKKKTKTNKKKIEREILFDLKQFYST